MLAWEKYIYLSLIPVEKQQRLRCFASIGEWLEGIPIDLKYRLYKTWGSPPAEMEVWEKKWD